MKKFTLTSSLLLAQLFHPILAFAQGFRIGDALSLDGGNTSVESTFPSLGSLVSTIVPNIFIAASIILTLLIVFGGATIVFSGGNAEQTDKGKQTITGAIIGFLVIFASYWIIQIIQIVFGLRILDSSII